VRARKWSVSTNRENLGYATLAASASARMPASSSPLPNGWNTILVKIVMSSRPATAWPTKSSERPALRLLSNSLSRALFYSYPRRSQRGTIAQVTYLSFGDG
jgi:hypothetical protein